jgi:hypothetical protein
VAKEATDFSRFREAMKQIVSVPKAELDRRDAEWRKARKARKTKTT